MDTIYKRDKVWYVNAIAGKRRICKRIGTSKKLAEIALEDLEAKLIRNELDLISTKRCQPEYCEMTSPALSGNA